MQLPRVGAHLPIGKGLKYTADQAVELGLECMQMFLRNPRGRGARNLSSEEIDYFRQVTSEHDIKPITVHIPYIANPASNKDDLYSFALETIEHDLNRCDLIGADYLVLHPGSYTTYTLDEGIKRVTDLLNQVLDSYTGDTIILLETMAGQGTEIGSSFDELNRILQNVANKDKIGVCYDTCHTFASGYDLTTQLGINNILKEIDDTFGREKIGIVHANDSSKELGAKRDRHAHIGEGFIGENGFKNLLTHDFWGKLPFILETPFEGIAKDVQTLKRLRSN
ncbi:MAG: deoxyribonuclease IV [Syntrophomonadaceae bacterium]|nr:deoxyribonuclease IV [Syntrophomonadaceae bacterium]